VGDAERQLRQAGQAVEAVHLAFELLHVRTVLEQHQLAVGSGTGAPARRCRRSATSPGAPVRPSVDAAARPRRRSRSASGLRGPAAPSASSTRQADRQGREHRVALLQRSLQRRVGLAQLEVDGRGALLQLGVAAFELGGARRRTGEAVVQAVRGRRSPVLLSGPGQASMRAVCVVAGVLVHPAEVLHRRLRGLAPGAEHLDVAARAGLLDVAHGDASGTRRAPPARAAGSRRRCSSAQALVALRVAEQQLEAAALVEQRANGGCFSCSSGASSSSARSRLSDRDRRAALPELLRSELDARARVVHLLLAGLEQRLRHQLVVGGTGICASRDGRAVPRQLGRGRTATGAVSPAAPAPRPRSAVGSRAAARARRHRRCRRARGRHDDDGPRHSSGARARRRPQLLDLRTRSLLYWSSRLAVAASSSRRAPGACAPSLGATGVVGAERAFAFVGGQAEVVPQAQLEQAVDLGRFCCNCRCARCSSDARRSPSWACAGSRRATRATRSRRQRRPHRRIPR
jgi:hypothetical protein